VGAKRRWRIAPEITHRCDTKAIMEPPKGVRMAAEKPVDEESVMAEGKARWLLNGGIDDLDDEERALLLAMISLEAGTGRTLTVEEQEALDQIQARSGAEGTKISQAIKKTVEAESKKKPPLDWSDLKDRLGRK
jgi:hypothetical protein